MADKNTGGSAFPSHGSMGEVAQDGMTLRDYFAAKVLQGDSSAEGGWSVNVTDEMIKARVAIYYRLADAMLEARKA